MAPVRWRGAWCPRLSGSRGILAPHNVLRFSRRVRADKRKTFRVPP